MALRDIRKESVIKAIEQFDEIGSINMLNKYGGKLSTRWYIYYNGKKYDQKLICRAAHFLQGLGKLPAGRGTFTASQASRKLATLGFEVKE